MAYGGFMDVSDAVAGRWARILGPLAKESRLFARALGGRADASSELFIVGVPEFEPWHFTAHMGEEATRHGRSDLVPTLLRWSVPPGAPPHLSVSVDSMLHATAKQTVLVINPGITEHSELLERVADARRRGSRIMTLHRGSSALVDLSHETLSVNASRPEGHFDLTQHVVTDLTPRAPDNTSMTVHNAPRRRRVLFG
jgi:alpha-beta hydrolase superfamily lysophospholipase